MSRTHGRITHRFTARSAQQALTRQGEAWILAHSQALMNNSFSEEDYNDQLRAIASLLEDGKAKCRLRENRYRLDTIVADTMQALANELPSPA